MERKKFRETLTEKFEDLVWSCENLITLIPKDTPTGSKLTFTGKKPNGETAVMEYYFAEINRKKHELYLYRRPEQKSKRWIITEQDASKDMKIFSEMVDYKVKHDSYTLGEITSVDIDPVKQSFKQAKREYKEIKEDTITLGNLLKNKSNEI
jgi:hypothetical protein